MKTNIQIIGNNKYRIGNKGFTCNGKFVSEVIKETNEILKSL